MLSNRLRFKSHYLLPMFALSAVVWFCTTSCLRVGFGMPEWSETNRECDEGCECSVGVPGFWVNVFAVTFAMGSPADESGRDVNETQHYVTLTRNYEIQITEVTLSQFEAVMGYLTSSSLGCEDCPIRFIHSDEAAAYCNSISDAAGLEHCYTCSGSGISVVCEPSDAYRSPYDCPGYRLPTEAEWENAARSGTTQARYGDLGDIAWWDGNSNGEAHQVAQKAVSPWGLYDMLGNAWEWCHDWYADYPVGSVTDPWGPATGSKRVKRGGHWSNSRSNTRAAKRASNDPADRDYNLGFRPVRGLDVL